MAGVSQHIDPIAGFGDALAERIVSKVLERLQPLLVQLQSTTLLEESGIDPMKVYSPREVAELLGTNRITSIYQIPKSELPRVKRIGSHIGYLGINLLCYMHNLPPIDMPAHIENFRTNLMQGAPKVQPLHPNKPGMTKIL